MIRQREKKNGDKTEGIIYQRGKKKKKKDKNEWKNSVGSNQ
jgi:hypothetical protein